ncbi:MAG TPA: lysylphosphatidylglycerol synthase domain-containing protein [Pedococcus sp.]|jgi:MFS family permease
MDRRRLLSALRIALAVLVTAAVVFAVAKNWTEVSADLRRMDVGTVALAGFLGCLPPLLTLFAWRRLLAELGSPIHMAPAGGIFFVGQLGKYVPGSVWAIVAQAEMAARLHVPRRRTAVTGLLNVGLAAVCGFIVGFPSLPLLLSRKATSTAGWVLVLVLPLLVLVLWPRLLNWAVALGLRVLRREPLEHELSGRAVLFTVGVFVLSWLCSGLSVFVIAHSIAGPGTDTGRLALATVSGFALAAAVSMFTVVLPAGVGLREGLLVLLLGPVISVPAAAAVVVVARFLTVLADVVFAGLGWAWARRHHLVTSRDVRAREHVVVDERPAG